MLEKVMSMAATDRIIYLPREPLYIPWDPDQDGNSSYYKDPRDSLKWHLDNMFSILYEYNGNKKSVLYEYKVNIRLNTFMYPSLSVAGSSKGWVNGYFNFQNISYSNSEICSGIFTKYSGVYFACIYQETPNDPSTLKLDYTIITSC